MELLKRACTISILYIGIVIYATLLILGMEFVSRGSLILVKKWVFEFPHEFMYASILVATLLIVFYGLNRKIFLVLTFFTSIFFAIFSLVNRIKLSLRGDPLIPADFTLLSEAQNMLSYFSTIEWWKTVGGIILVVGVISGVIYGIFKIPKEIKKSKSRILIAICAGLLMFGIYYEEVEANYSDIRAKYGIKTIDYNQKQNYELNGVLMAFLRNIKWLSVEKPTTYTKDKINELVKIHEIEPYPVTEDKPHIIIIMSEAFWDPTQMENVKFNQDPLENFHEISSSHTSGQLLAPVFGGSTANTEFESMTGYSMNFLPAGSIPYLFHVKKPILSLPRILKDQGYDTTAYHSYHNWFYQRNLVYKNLGFDRFVSLEFIPEPKVDALYYRDREVNDMIIEQIQNAKEPQFVFGVTMQNHGPFQSTVKKDYATIEVENKNMSEESKNILEYFSDNMVEMDKELTRMIKKMEELDEKVMIIYYGDHLPLLGLNYQVYKEAGYFADDVTYEDYLKMYSTPLLIWDNFSDSQEEIAISAPFLPAIILEKAGLEGSPLTNFLNSEMELGNSLFPRKDFSENVALSETFYETYELLQYDALFGEKYDQTFRVESNPDFQLGLESLKISSVIYDANEKNLKVVGKNFTTRSKLLINGESVNVIYDKGNLVAPNLDIQTGDQIQVQILDSYERKLRTSNTFIVK